MFRCGVALGHQTCITVERSSGPVDVAFSTVMLEARAERGSRKGCPALGVLVGIDDGLDKLTKREDHWCGPSIRTSGVVLDEDYARALPEAALTVGCVRTVMDTRNATIRIDGLVGYHSLETGQTQLNAGVVGIVSNNRVVYMTPQLSRWSMPTHVREFKDEHTGFLCPLHTSMGPSAGSTRMVLDNVRVRVMNEVQRGFMANLIGMVRDMNHAEESPRHTLVLLGRRMEVSEEVARNLIVAYRSTSHSYHTPTIHVSETGEYVVSVHTGALMRHVEGLGWVDSIMGDPSKRQVWNTTTIPPYDTDRYTQLFCSQSAMTPFSSHMPVQRAALSGHFMSSSISYPANTISHRIVCRYFKTLLAPV